jgi:putative transposase
MCNDAIRIALSEKPRSRFALIKLAYDRLKLYGLHTHYILSACEVAFSNYQNPNRRRSPFVRRPFLKLDSQSYRLNYLLLKLPTKPRNFIYLALDGSLWHRKLLSDVSLKHGSVTITDDSVIIALTKNTSSIVPLGQMGVDVNEKNVTIADTDGRTAPLDATSVTEIRERYRQIRAKMARNTWKDDRVQRILLRRYGDREKQRTMQLLHALTKKIVTHAKENAVEIKMERLKGIRKLYRKANGQGPLFRGRMNTWAFHEIQRQIEYKAKWEGIPVSYVNPRNTSRICPDCNSRVLPLTGRRLECAKCVRNWDRDILAARNIMAAPMVRAARPSECSGEGEPRRQESAGNPLSRRMEVDSRTSTHESSGPTSVR